MESIYTFVTYKLNNTSLEVLQCPEMNNICSRVFKELALLRIITGAFKGSKGQKTREHVIPHGGFPAKRFWDQALL